MHICLQCTFKLKNRCNFIMTKIMTAICLSILSFSAIQQFELTFEGKYCGVILSKQSWL